MRIIVAAKLKGGTGATTFVSALGTHIAAEERAKVTLVDADPQQSLGLWWERRGEPANPNLITVRRERDLARELGKLRVSKGDWGIVDTPPALVKWISSAIELADFVVILARPGIFDVEAIAPVIELCVDNDRPYAIVLTHVEDNTKLLSETLDALQDCGPEHVMEDQVIHYSDAWGLAAIEGQTGAELKTAAGKAAAKDIAAVWKEIKRRMTSKRGRP